MRAGTEALAAPSTAGRCSISDTQSLAAKERRPIIPNANHVRGAVLLHLPVMYEVEKAMGSGVVKTGKEHFSGQQE